MAIQQKGSIWYAVISYRDEFNKKKKKNQTHRVENRVEKAKQTKK